MATYSKVLSGNSNYTVYLDVNQTSQSIANNSSTISWSLRVVKASGSGYWANDSNASNYAVNIDGVNVSSGQKSYDFTGSTPKTITVASGTRTVSHSADGSKSIAVSGYWRDNKNGMGSATASGTLALSTIARATQPSLSKTSANLGDAITINLPRASSSFTHRIYYNFFNAKGLTNGIANSTNATTSTTFTLPTALASTYMARTTSNGMVVYVETKNGNTVIGTKSVALTVNVPNNSTYNPTIVQPTWAETVALITSSTPGVVVNGLSKPKFSAVSTTRMGASISSIKINMSRTGYNWSGNMSVSGSTGTYTWSANTVGSWKITATVTDSRGRTATSPALNIGVSAYSKPKLSANAYRSQTDSRKIMIYAKATWYGLGGANRGDMEAYIKVKGASSWGTAVKTGNATTGTIEWATTAYGNYSEASSYEVMIRAKDELNGWTSVTHQISTGKDLISVYKDVGVAIGKIYDPAIGGGLQVGGNATFENAITMNGGISPINIPSNSNLNNYHTPGLYYVPMTATATTIANTPNNSAFSLLVEKHAGVKQTFTSYFTATPFTYVRNFYDGIWGPWHEQMLFTRIDNSNGQTLRYADGTQICLGKASFSVTAQDCYVVLPATYVNTDFAITVSGGNGNWNTTEDIEKMGFGPSNTGGIRVRKAGNLSFATSSGSIPINFMTIGRWK